MKEKKEYRLFKEIGGIDEKYIEEALGKSEKKGASRAAVILIAAVLAVAAALFAVVPALNRPQGPVAPIGTDPALETYENESSIPDTDYETEAPFPESTPGTEPYSPEYDPLFPETGGVGGVINSCEIHSPGYHTVSVRLLDFAGIKREDFAEWVYSLEENDPDTGCPEMVNVVDFVRHFNVPRETFERYLAANYYSLFTYYDLDAIYSGEEGPLNKWICTDFKENYEKAEGWQKWVIYTYRLLLAELTVNDERFSASRDEYYVPRDPAPEPEKVERLEKMKLDDPRFYKRLYVSAYYRLNDKYVDSGYAFVMTPVATLIRDIGVDKETAKSVYADAVIESRWCKHWRIDFDKLYADLDYYADLLGKPGYEYPQLVDAEYLIK